LCLAKAWFGYASHRPNTYRSTAGGLITATVLLTSSRRSQLETDMQTVHIIEHAPISGISWGAYRSSACIGECPAVTLVTAARIRARYRLRPTKYHCDNCRLSVMPLLDSSYTSSVVDDSRVDSRRKIPTRLEISKYPQTSLQQWENLRRRRPSRSVILEVEYRS
jgi:hypothetical protein